MTRSYFAGCVSEQDDMQKAVSKEWCKDSRDFRKYRYYTIDVAMAKALISCAVTDLHLFSLTQNAGFLMTRLSLRKTQIVL